MYTIIMLLSTGIDYVHGRLVSGFREKEQMKKARAAVASMEGGSMKTSPEAAALIQVK